MDIEVLKEELKIVDLSQKLSLLREWNKKLYSILQKTSYTEEDKQFIKDYVDKGIYQETINASMNDKSLREHVLGIKNAYRFLIGKRDETLKTIYADRKMFFTISDSMYSKIMQGKGEQKIEDYTDLINDYIRRVVDMGTGNALKTVDNLYNYMSPKEFQSTNVYRTVTEKLERINEGEDVYKSKKLQKFYLYGQRYIGYLIMNGIEVDFDNDRLLNQYSDEDKEKLRQEVKIQKNLHGMVTKDSIEEISIEELSKLSKDLLVILDKESYSDFDKAIIRAYAENGYYKKFIEQGIENQNSRDLILKIRSNYKSKIGKKSEDLKNIYPDNEMFAILNKIMKERIRQGTEKNRLSEYDAFINDYINKVVDVTIEGFESIEQLEKVMTVEEFRKSRTFNSTIELLRSQTRDKMKLKPKQIENIKKFIMGYTDNLIAKGDRLDIDSDELLKVGLEFEQYSILGKKLLLEDEPERQYTVEELKAVNFAINEILDKSFENTRYFLSEQDKKYITKYFSTFYNKSMTNIIGNKEMQDIIITLNKINRHGISGREGDNKFINGLFTRQQLRDLIEQNIDVEQIEQGNIPNIQELEEILTLLASTSLKITRPFEIGISGLKQKGVDIYHSKVMEAYIQNFAFLCAQIEGSFSQIAEDDKNKFEFLYEYIDNVSKSKDFSLFKEQGLSDMIQLVYANRLPKEVADRILGILEKNLEISKINVSDTKKKLDNFLVHHNGQVITNEQAFDEFLQNVQSMKLGNSLRIDDNIIRFIISQTLEEKSIISKNPEKYQCVVERALEDLGRNDVSAKANQEKGYVYFTRDVITRREVDGMHYRRSKSIVFKRSKIKNLLKSKDIEVLDAIFHENTHADQDYDIKKGKYENYSRYMMVKEDILRKYNSQYYRANYSLMFIEIEARENAARKLGKFLEQIMTTTNKQAIYKSVMRKDIITFLQELAQNERAKYSEGIEKKISIKDIEKENVSDYFDRIVKQHPQIIGEHPELKREYHEDGTLRRIGEILPDIANVKDNRERILWRNILNKGNIFRVETLSEDIESLMEFETDDPGTSSIVSLIVSDNIGRMLEEILNDTSKLEPEQLLQLQNTLRKVQKFMEAHKGQGAFCKGILRKKSKDSDAKSPSQLMQMVLDKRVEDLKIEQAEETVTMEMNSGNIKNFCKDSYHGTTTQERSEVIHKFNSAKQRQSGQHEASAEQDADMS